jgi:hypothetical protein
MFQLQHRWEREARADPRVAMSAGERVRLAIHGESGTGHGIELIEQVAERHRWPGLDQA